MGWGTRLGPNALFFMPTLLQFSRSRFRLSTLFVTVSPSCVPIFPLGYVSSVPPYFRSAQRSFFPQWPPGSTCTCVRKNSHSHRRRTCARAACTSRAAHASKTHCYYCRKETEKRKPSRHRRSLGSRGPVK